MSISIEAAFASPVIAAAIAIIPYAIYFYWQRKRKANAAISLILQYAKDAEETTTQWFEGFDDIMKNIEDGAPYGEPQENYTPLICYTGMDKLSFEKVSEIRQYLTKDEQDSLFAYLMAESTRDSLVWAINTDFFRKFQQERKAAAWNAFMEEEKKVEEKAKALITVLDRRKKPLL